MTKTIILLAMLAAMTAGPIVEGCGFMPRIGALICIAHSDGRLR